MKQSVNKIAILNMLSTFILQGIAFISTPIFTRLLGTAQFGKYMLFNSWMLILTCIMGLGIHSSIGTGIYTFKENYVSFRNSVLLSSTIICCAEVGIIFVLREQISGWIDFPKTIILLLGVSAFSHYVVNFAQASFIYEKKALCNLVLSISVATISVLLSVYLIYRVDNAARYMGRIYGVVITYLGAAVVVWLLLYLRKPVCVKLEYLKYGLVVGFPIVFHALSQQILGQSDRVMMQMFGIAASEIGIYSLFYTLSSVLSTVLAALNNSWCPFYYDDLSEKRWCVLEKKSKNYIELFTVLGIGFLLLSREVTYLMADESYWGGINIIPVLAFAVYFTFMYQFPVNFEFFHRKTQIIAIGTIGAGILNIILNAALIPKWGMYGAAFATAVSYFALFLVHYFIVTHMKEYSYHLDMKVFIPGVIGMLVGVVMFYALSPWWYLRWGLGAGLGGLEVYRIIKRKSIF